jgi:hypothetical protein
MNRSMNRKTENKKKRQGMRGGNALDTNQAGRKEKKNAGLIVMTYITNMKKEKRQCQNVNKKKGRLIYSPLLFLSFSETYEKI